MDRHAVLLPHLDLANGRGLEIGALHKPVVLKSEADVRYLDHEATVGLHAKYTDFIAMDVDLDKIVDVDFVWSPGRTLPEVVGSAAPFDYVVAAHVIEHLPDTLGWLRQLHAILRTGGRVALVIPDKRFCFDANRPLSTMADLVDAYLRKVEVPTFRHIFDYEASFLPVDAGDLWRGADVTDRRRDDVDDPDRHALSCCVDQARTGGYRDVHCTTYTPASFVDLMDRAARLELVDFVIPVVHATEPGDLEFGVILESLPPGLSPSGRSAAIDAAKRSRLAAVPGWGLGGDRPDAMPVSTAERRLIEAKRRVTRVGRGATRRAHQSLARVLHRR